MSQNCPYCREVLTATNHHSCPTCGTPHHLDCWQENCGCTVFGCQSAPSDDPKIAVTVPDFSSASTPRVQESATYFVARGQQQNGPYTLTQVREQLQSYQVTGTDLIWTQGMANWVPISQVIGTAVAQPSPYLSAPAYKGTPLVQQQADPFNDGRMHFGRGLYFLCMAALFIVVVFLCTIEPGFFLLGLIGFIVLTSLRLRDVGHSAWMVLLIIVPFANLYLIHRVSAAPRGYVITNTSDTAMTIMTWVLVVLFLLNVFARIASTN